MIHTSWGIIIASGKGEQLAPDVDLAFLSVASKPVLAYSLLAYEQCPDIDGIVVVVGKERMDAVVTLSRMFGSSKLKKVVAGTAQRGTSVQKGLGSSGRPSSVAASRTSTSLCRARVQTA